MGAEDPGELHDCLESTKMPDDISTEGVFRHPKVSGTCEIKVELFGPVTSVVDLFIDLF